MRRSLVLLVLSSLVLLLPLAGQAQPVPRLVSYQGVLFNGGSPVTTATSVTFAFFSDAACTTAFPAAAAWSQTLSITPDAAGGFATLLGSEDPANAAYFDFAFDRLLYLKTSVGGTQVACQELAAAPYALGLYGLRVQPAPDPTEGGPNVIGGWSGNSVGAGVVGATISGGGGVNYIGPPAPNTVTADYGTVGGGLGNEASGFGATVGGGGLNTASGGVATVGGGDKNTASGYEATVPGGLLNLAGGAYSFAAGRRAKVRDDDPASPFYSGDSDGDEGTFVWADATEADFTSTGPDQFLVRAVGGVGIGTNSPANQLTVAGSADFTGSVGIGTNTPDAPLDLQGQNNWSPATTEGDFRIGNDTHRLVFGVALDGSGAGHARIHTKSSSSDRLYLGNDGTDVAVIQSTVGLYPAADNTFSLGQSGQSWTEVWSVDGSINTSDRRAKEEIEGLDYGLEAVLRLRAVSYRWKDRPGGQRRLGLIAQEVAEVVPEVVRRPASTGALLGLSYGELVPVLIRAVQQQQAEITQQQAEIEALRAQVAQVDQVQTEMARQQAEMAALRALVEANAATAAPTADRSED